MASKKKGKVSGDRNVSITGRLAFPEPEYEDGEVKKSDLGFAGKDKTYHTNIVVRPDGTLALNGWPPAAPDDDTPEDLDPDINVDGSKKSDQQKAIERSEELKTDPEHKKAPIIKI